MAKSNATTASTQSKKTRGPSSRKGSPAEASSASQPQLGNLLVPKLQPNKKYLKRENLREKRREAERARELSLSRRRKLAEKAAKKASSTAPKQKASSSAAPSSKETATTPTTTTAASVSGKTTKQARPAKPTKKPKAVVAKAKTGKETFRKSVAKELVKQHKAEQQQKLREKLKVKKEAKKDITVSPSTVGKAARGGTKTLVPSETKTAGKRKNRAALPAKNGDEGVETAQDKLLLERAIRGEDVAGADGSAAGFSSSFVRHDPTLYPDLAFFDDYAEKKSAEIASEDALLKDAHKFFKELGKRERRLNMAASRRLKELKAINRRGGDRDGFRYVVPKNAKQLVRQMVIAEGAGAHGVTAEVDPDSLVSSFGGSGVGGSESTALEEASDKPSRRRNKRSSTFSDFYQFQVSRRWTRNAESFLNRGRASKSLFEAKKRQRSIKKL